jgi:NIMA-interacting peptidyl-prolyl cis-trans isomerase 1
MSDWEVRFSNSRKLPYYYNGATRESTWEVPAGMTEEQVLQLPGAHHLSGAEAPPRDDKVRASHILSKHSGSRRPSSWKQVCKRKREEMVEAAVETEAEGVAWSGSTAR